MARLRPLFVALGLLLASMLPAFAADRALIDIIGYSADGHYFAFEEFGVHDGSGFAFSNVFVIDLTTDSFVAGAPFSAVADDAHADRPLADVRAEAKKAAAPALKRYAVSNPAEIWTMLGDGVGKADGKTMNWSIPNCCSPGSTEDKVFSLKLTTFNMPATAECDSLISQAPLGFALSLSDDSGPSSSEIHRDKTLPKSRGCTEDYRLYAVVAPFDDFDHLVAIVSYYPFGFEGTDRRFLAVPLGQ